MNIGMIMVGVGLSISTVAFVLMLIYWPPTQ
jgi:hypothetical protein